MGDLRVNEIEEQKAQDKQRPLSRHRELFSILVSESPKVREITGCDKEGDMTFNINLKEAGLSPDVFNKFNKEIFSNFVTDFMGELFVRDNISIFAPFLSSMKMDAYLKVSGSCVHKRFGMKIKNGCMVFSFHITFLQKILTEDFKSI